VVTPAPAVSVAIRAFRRNWIERAIDSVLAQTWRDLELVVYDDAGDMEDIVRRFNNPRLRYERAKRSHSASGRFAAAVALCRGRYIGVLDDDDRYEPQFVERLCEALEKCPSAAVAYCRCASDVRGTSRKETAARNPGNPSALVREILMKNWRVSPSQMLLRRSALDETNVLQFMPEGVAPDFFVNIHLAMAGWEHVAIDDVLAVRGVHGNQLSKSPEGYDMAVTTLEQLQTADPEIERMRRDDLARRHVQRAFHHLREGRRREAVADVRKSAAIAPVYRLARRAIFLSALLPLAGPLAAQIAVEMKRRFLT
jgi:glycosyltransferase involved in cell wall biosynthesis